MRQQTPGLPRLLREDNAGAHNVEFANVPAVFHTLDARRSGVLAPQRRAAAARVVFPAHAGGSDIQTAYFPVGHESALVVYGAVIAVVDNAVYGGAVDNLYVAGAAAFRDIDTYAHLQVRGLVSNAAESEAAASPIQVVAPAGGTAQPQDELMFDGGIAHEWSGAQAAVQTVRFDKPLHIQGARSDAVEQRPGLAVVYRRVFGIGDVDAVLLWLDCAVGPRGTEPQ